MRKLTIEDMQAIAKERGGECLSKRYTNAHTKLKWRCGACGHAWRARPANIKGGTWCPECSKKYVRRDNPAKPRKLTIEIMKAEARARGGECLSEIYKNNTDKLKWRCGACGHEWDAPYTTIQIGGWCPPCSRARAGKKQRGNIEAMHKLAAKRGGKCLSTTYTTAHTKLEWECAKCDHTWWATPDKIAQGQWCPECGKKKCGDYRRLSIEKMKAIAKQRGGKCLSKEYRTNTDKLKWQCAHGHIWESAAANVLSGKWCHECASGVSERICRTIFEQIFKKPFPKIRPDWLRNKAGNRMELDGYCEELGIAFEHHGRQHYKKVEFFHPSENALASRKKADAEKKTICKKNGVRLIEVPSLATILTPEEGVDYIISQCVKLKLIRRGKIDRDNIDYSCAYASSVASEILDSVRQVIKKKGGTLLSKEYKNARAKLQVRCQDGHVWGISADNLLRGKWCMQCGGRAKKSIVDMQAIAEKRGGKCISKVYRNARSRLIWECSKGHRWPAIADHVARGSWCPECFEKRRGKARRLTIEQMQALAKDRGGRCLSKEYVNSDTELEWECGEGHTWHNTPRSLKAGSWCPECGKRQRGKARLLTIEEMHAMAKKRGGKCLSKKYINSRTSLKWECSKGHRWETAPVNIRSGAWCHVCAKQRGALKQRDSIQSMSALAKQKGGKCLSKVYINSKTKLKWQCSEGHTWDTKPETIKRGRWCPTCARTKAKGRKRRKK